MFDSGDNPLFERPDYVKFPLCLQYQSVRPPGLLNIMAVIGSGGFKPSGRLSDRLIDVTYLPTDRVSGNPAARRMARGSMGGQRSGILKGWGGQKWLGGNSIRAITEFGKIKKGLFSRSAALMRGCAGLFSKSG